ncbi:MAG: dTMP kinase [Actinobacteria bacterium]|nr:dTMP kinase [Actinomycetota bacterium]
MSGFYLALEGGEGAGKTTLAKLVCDQLEHEGHQVVLVREPGGTTLGDEIRSLVLQSEAMSPWAEAFLFATQRAQLVSEVVGPALAEGKLVVTDRSLYSSLAYQGGARGLGIDRVRALNLLAVEGCIPDLVVVLEVEPEIGMARQDSPPDRIGGETPEFQAKVAEAYRELARQEPDRVFLVPAEDDPVQVLKRVRELIEL